MGPQTFINKVQSMEYLKFEKQLENPVSAFGRCGGIALSWNTILQSLLRNLNDLEVGELTELLGCLRKCNAGF